MTPIQYLHAFLAVTDEGLSKFIFGAIFVVIWIVSAVASALNKRSVEAKRRLQMGSGSAWIPERNRPNTGLAEAIRERLPPVDVRPPKRSGVRATGTPAKQSRKQPSPQRKPQKRPAPPPLPRSPDRVVRIEEEERTQSLVATTPVLTATPARSSMGVGAPAIRRWLTPATLRQQFILTELLQPPKALRPDESSW